MHYSGHQDCLFNFINTLFNTIYISDNPELANYINTSNNEYKNTNNPEICGNIIATFCTRRYDLQSFCNLAMLANCLAVPVITSRCECPIFSNLFLQSTVAGLKGQF